MLQLDPFKDITERIISTAGTQTQMTIKYLKDMSVMLATASLVREGDLKKHFSTEREILKLIFAFVLINRAS